MGTRSSFPGVKRPGGEADSPQSSAENKEWVELYLHFPNTPSWRGAPLKHWDKYTFTKYFQGDQTMENDMDDLRQFYNRIKGRINR